MKNLMELKNVSLLGCYAQRRNCQESLKWFGMQLATGHKINTKSRIEEPSNPIDSLDRISARAHLTPECHTSEVSLLIDFEK
jgi:hypothetical protein